MRAPRTLQAAREILFAALTSPVVTYQQDQGDGTGFAPIDLPAANVVPRSVWLVGDTPPPTPYVCFAVAGRGSTSRFIADRRLRIIFWVVGDYEDQITELYEAIRARVNFGDQDAGFFATDLSRVNTATQLGTVFREIVERTSYPADFDKTTARWQMVAEYDAIAT